ncbi:Methyltransferase type 11 [Chloroherpeton thalassium ATCC 35110]|uniref:Methyltransferase type 11 n=1 Tax=Chloroherpeton thalassium (strain ATCC 35110 / GB-78) TaxID=517418 RepID=B3QYU0_CHLT3|nr:class I SAM-dependent methyltransferase [Chloroherpeton thalassium]ACF15163.1 Methyltransferase type 11 [Chloroherpeton thalassium ATCC 35110]
MQEQKTIQDAKNFWNVEACGTQFIQERKSEKDFFLKYIDFRYKTEWHIPQLVPFEQSKGKKVLEIGCGNGADGYMFAKNGAIYTGVDLTETAVQTTQKHFELLGANGTFQVENAEKLSFADNSFDIVYSHGVLHHTQNPPDTFKEVHRVLKPGGTAIIMLYHKNSFNHYIRILGYMRLRLLIKILQRIGRWDVDRKKIAGKELSKFRGNEGSYIWELHYENFLTYGWAYLKPENFVHHCTDGPECPYAYVYSKTDIKSLFSQFKELSFTVAHFPLKKYSFGKFIPLALEKSLAPTMGWYLFIYAKK